MVPDRFRSPCHRLMQGFLAAGHHQGVGQLIVQQVVWRRTSPGHETTQKCQQGQGLGKVADTGFVKR
nr:hypothetical protein [Pontibacter liquoris]